MGKSKKTVEREEPFPAEDNASKGKSSKRKPSVENSQLNPPSSKKSKKSNSNDVLDDLNSIFWEKQTQSDATPDEFSQGMFTVDTNNPGSIMLTPAAHDYIGEREKIINKLNALKIIYDKDVNLPSILYIQNKSLDELRQLENDFNARINLLALGGFGEGAIMMINKFVSWVFSVNEETLHQSNRNNRNLILSFQELSRNLMYAPSILRAPITYVTSVLPVLQAPKKDPEPVYKPDYNPPPPPSTQPIKKKRKVTFSPTPPPPPPASSLPDTDEKFQDESEDQYPEYLSTLQPPPMNRSDTLEKERQNQNQQQQETVNYRNEPNQSLPQFHITSYQGRIQ